MIKIIRFSKEGFKPQKQTHHINLFEGYKTLDMNQIPKHLRLEIEKIRNEHISFYEEHKSDLEEGLWFFIDGYKNRQSLNHLKELVPCWEAEIEEDVLVYDCNREKVVPITDSIVKFGGCYIPKRLLSKVHNIKRRKKGKENG